MKVGRGSEVAQTLLSGRLVRPAAAFGERGWHSAPFGTLGWKVD
jgi:hypothetical protein